MTEPTPVLHLLAGPNGAGKSTLFRLFLAPVLHLPFVNADLLEVAARDVGDELDSYAAAAIASDVREELIRGRRSFVTETVFSHPSKVDLVKRAVHAGYLVTLHVAVAPVDLCVERVRIRASQGGHAVPEQKVRERYERLWSLVVDASRHAGETVFYDTSAGKVRVVARLVDGRTLGSPAWPGWAPDTLRSLT